MINSSVTASYTFKTISNVHAYFFNTEKRYSDDVVSPSHVERYVSPFQDESRCIFTQDVIGASKVTSVKEKKNINIKLILHCRLAFQC